MKAKWEEFFEGLWQLKCDHLDFYANYVEPISHADGWEIGIVKSSFHHPIGLISLKEFHHFDTEIELEANAIIKKYLTKLLEEIP